MKQQKMTQRRLDGYIRLAEIINWGRMYPVRFVEKVFGIELLDYQKYIFMSSWTTKNVLWCMSRNAGKALSLDTNIPTPNGNKTMGELKVGDYVFDADGKPTKITYTSPIYLNNECYKITFEDGEEIVADAEHQWYVYDIFSNASSKNEYVIRLTKQMANKYIVNKQYKYSIPLCNPINYQKKDFLINPYVLGVWLGDGDSSNPYITSHINDYQELKMNLEDCGVKIDVIKYESRPNIVKLKIDLKTLDKLTNNTKNKTKLNLKELNLINNKHIPEEYFYGSIQQRLNLLQGLMDTDGSIDKAKNCRLTQSNYEFIKQFSRLLDSLGIKNNIKTKNAKCNGNTFITYSINFRTDINLPCFKLKRKYDMLPVELTNSIRRKAIKKIEKVPTVPVKCITVDNEKELYLCGKRNTVTHNTFLAVPFIMSKALLIPNHSTYLLAGTASQSQNLFLKLEKTAKKEIESLTGLTDIFANEIIRTNSLSDGFIHEQSQYKCSMFNGSTVTSLSGAYDRNRGHRSNLNVYDEGGFSPAELFEATKPFTTQDSNFKLGGNIDLEVMPEQFPNQLLYASSASSVDTYFYNLYKDFSKKMFLGDRDYFVADINSDVIMNATFNGKIYPVPLLTQSVIDEAMRINPEAAMREYKNIFTRDGGDAQIIKRATIIRNSKVYVPEFVGTKNKKYALAFDPARQYDNSIITVGEIFLDENVGHKMRIVNCVSFADIMKKNHTPIRTPEQILQLKQMILDYNGEKSADYENIQAVMIDSGSGGGGVLIADDLMPDWTDSNGVYHRGLIDKEVSADYIFNFPNALDKLKLMAPSKYKKEMFEALIEMLNLNLIEFPEAYDGKDFVTTFDDKGREVQYMLSQDEKLALIQIDLLKEEMVNIYRFESTNGNCRYDLAPHKEAKMHDDRVFTLAMLAWLLQQIRRENITTRKSLDMSDIDFLAGFAELF